MSGKRASIFNQGKPERPYDERDDGQVEIPQRATAAQMAARKIKSTKPRRTQSSSLGLSSNANFAPPQQSSGFNFGTSTPVGDSSANPFGFLSQQQSTPSAGAFGNTATNSFPPAQAPTPSNNFANSSFPAFGGDNVNTFNPQPPTADFSFTAAGVQNPFAASAPAPVTNGSGQGGFSGSIFSIQAQPASNPFTTFSNAAQNNDHAITANSNPLFGTAAPSQKSGFGGFGSGTQDSSNTATAAATQVNPPGEFTSAPPSSNNTATEPQSNLFGGFGSTPSVANSAPSNFFSGSGSTAQVQDSAPASSNVFSGFGSTAQNGTSTPAPNSTPFGGFGSTAQNDASTPAPQSTPFTAPKTNLFGFGSTSQTNNATATASDSTQLNAGTTPNSHTFGGFSSTALNPNTSKGLFSSTTFTPLGATKGPESTTPASKPFSGFGSTQQNEKKSTGLFAQPQTTSQPASTGLFFPSATQEPLPSTEPLPPRFEPPKENPFRNLSRSPSPSKDPAATRPSLKPPEENPFARLSRSPSPTKERAPATPTSTMPTLTGAVAPPPEAPRVTEPPKIPKAQAPSSWPKASVADLDQAANLDELDKTMVDLAAELATLNERYREKLINLIPMADWSALSSWHVKESGEITKKIVSVKKQRAAAKGITGHESALSTKRKVVEETGQENENTTPKKRVRGSDAVSTPTPQQPALPSSTFTANPPASQTSNLFGNILSKAPASTLGVTALSNSNKEEPKALKANTISRPGFQVPSFGNSSTATSSKDDKISQSGFQVPSFASSSGLASKPTSKDDITKKDATSQSGFQVPAFGSSSNAAGSKDGNKSQSGFQIPSFSASNGASSSKNNRTSQSGLQPSSFSSSGGAPNFLSQFSKKAKSYEELAAERKKKAFEADYDSDDETEEQWSARYDKEEAARLAKEKEKVESAPHFGNSTAPEESNDTAPASKSHFSFSKPASGTSTPGLFGSRVGSPAPSTSGGQSVFDTPKAAQTPALNIFGHLPSGPSSNDQDESSDEEDYGEHTEGQSQTDQPAGSVRPSPPSKRKLAESESESEESLEEFMRRKKQGTATSKIAASKPSLLSRMTRADDDEANRSDAEKDTDQSDKGVSILGRSNGVKTPAKPFQFFDFDKAGAQTVPSKLDSFAGDQTFKPGTPIKFGVPATDTKANANPTFKFDAASPLSANSTTPAKGSPFSLFSQSAGVSNTPAWLSTNMNVSGPGSIGSSALSSRAPTPSSEVETSGKDSAAENDEDEGAKSNQLDLSQLTEKEEEEHEVMFHTEQAIAKQQVEKDGVKAWENFARGPLWILLNKDSGRSIVRMRISSGATPVNYNILPKIEAKVAGASQKMVLTSRPTPEGKISNVFFAVKNTDVAEEFVTIHNMSLPKI